MRPWLRSRGPGIWDAPVSGGTVGAEQATLVGTADIGVDGAISLRCDVMMGGATAVTVELSGTVSDATDDVLELACDRVKLEGSSEDAAKLVSDAMGWTIDSEGLVSSALPALRLAQLYLDQDCHIVGPLAEGAADDEDRASPDESSSASCGSPPVGDGTSSSTPFKLSPSPPESSSTRTTPCFGKTTPSAAVCAPLALPAAGCESGTRRGESC